MDEVRKVAKAYYNGAEAAEKKLARQFFQSLDTNADGKVSRREYEKAVGNSSSFTDNDFFLKLDADGNKTLDFEEVLALYYLEKVSIPRCRACESLLLDSYFSCLPCQADVSYYLCCDCYGRGNFKHHHPSHKFIDTRAMLKLLDQILKQSQITNHQTDEFDLMQKTKNVKAGEKQSDSQQSSNMETIVKSLEAMDKAASIGCSVVSAGAMVATAASAMGATATIGNAAVSAGAAITTAAGALGAGATIGNVATTAAIAVAATCRIM
ncbi:uncharacterized protein LOC125216929 [Salvia hispanica]|uniref:uncharacterized protein LOC125216929 n=1 Tax=Salvia hispanica TaxID=49212 RepID=UPI00200923E1|nr:uncharacterized protein LOC125216929 [Salvia hispanica]